MNVRKIGLDPGFGGVKVAEIVENRIATLTLPSVVGVGSTDTGALDLAGITRRDHMPKPFRVSFDGIEYLVGSGVSRYAKPIERMDLNRFTDSIELRALFYVALNQIIDGGVHDLVLAIGLPVEVLQDTDRATIVERDIGKWMLGEHKFVVNDHPAMVNIVKLRAKAQPLATWLDWGLNLEGKWTQGKHAVKAPALILDQGFNTLDAYGIENGEVSARYTGGENLGMRRAAEMVINSLDRQYGTDMSLHEADWLVRSAVIGKKAVTYIDGEPTDITHTVKQAIDSLASDALKFAEHKVGKASKFKVLITGGGGLALGQRWLRQYPKATIMPEPVLANARGLAKLAVRPGFLD